MARPRTAPRSLIIALLSALFLVLFPVEQVRAQELPPETKYEQLDVQDGAQAGAWLVSDPVAAPFPFSMVGLRGGGVPDVWLRYVDEEGVWSDWIEVEALDELDGPDQGTREERLADTIQGDGWVGEPIWVGEATALQLRRRSGTLDEVEVHVIDSMGLSETLLQRVSRTLRSYGTAAPAEASTFSGIVTRSEWGADESIRRGSPSYATVRFGVVHHTATGNGYTREQAPGIVRGIYAFHVNGNGWSDIGYNLLVDRFGTVYEGRYGGVDRGVVGAHARNYNSGSFGVAIIGNFELEAPPTVAVNAASDLIAWKYAVHGLNAATDARVTHNGQSIRTLVGHRDVGSTACPGAYLYSQMGAIRERVASKVASFAAGWTPVVGDWNGDGRTTIGWFRDGQWRLHSSNGNASQVTTFRFGSQGDLPVVGDWTGDGVTTVGVVREGQWHLRFENRGGPADHTFWYGRGGIDHPMAGDWNGDGRDTPAIVRDGEWHLRNSLAGGPGHRVFVYGRVLLGDIPVVGDWNGDGRDSPGILRDGEWHLRNSQSGGPGEIVFTYGRVTRGDVPIVGDWTGAGRTAIGVTRGGMWHLRNSVSGGAADRSFLLW